MTTDLDRTLDTLFELIDNSGYQRQDLEKQLDPRRGKGYLSKLQARDLVLRVDVLNQLLELIEVEPGKFWLRVYPEALNEQQAELVRVESELRDFLARIADRD